MNVPVLLVNALILSVLGKSPQQLAQVRDSDRAPQRGDR
jgi:hypothetical protein